MSRLSLSVVMLACLVQGAWAANGPPSDGAMARFETAQTHYRAGEYDQAMGIYQGLVDEGISDPALMHNLGNAAFRAGRFGRAVWSYRRALRIAPDHALATPLERNLEITRDALRERYRMGSDGSEVLYTEPGGLFYRLTHLVPEGVASVTFLVFWALFCALLIVRRLRPNAAWPGASAVAALVFVVLFGLLLWGRVWAAGSLRIGVILDEGVALQEARHRDAQGVDIPEGMEVRVHSSFDGWSRVELPSGRVGFVMDPQVGEI